MGSFKGMVDEVVVPAGKYIGKIVEAEARISKRGSPMIAGQFEICEGSFAKARVPFFAITEVGNPGAEMGRRLLKSLDIDVSMDFDDAKVAKALVGREAMAGISMRESPDGLKTNCVSIFGPKFVAV
jgi:hypothetical protein